MSSLSEIYIKKETLETMLQVLNKKTGDDAKGIKITLSINDESGEYGQNIFAYAAQTKEQQEAKAKKFPIANGKVFWTNGKIEVAKKKEQTQSSPVVQNTTQSGSDLPF